MDKPTKITFTATPEARKLLLDEQYKRRTAGRDDWSVEKLVLDAIQLAYGEPTRTKALRKR